MDKKSIANQPLKYVKNIFFLSSINIIYSSSYAEIKFINRSIRNKTSIAYISILKFGSPSLISGKARSIGVKIIDDMRITITEISQYILYLKKG